MSNEWSNIQEDEDGHRYLVDDFGNPLLDEQGRRISPRQSKEISNPGEFTIYDSSEGHCSLCGSLYCNGGCFR